LHKASADGRLATALKLVREQRETENLRIACRRTLMEACANGRLSGALKQVAERREQDTLRLEARDCLLKACKEGRLAKAMPAACETEATDDLEELRSQARATILKAVELGTLGEALKTAKGQVALQRNEDVRLLAQRSFVEACKDGRLGNALKEVREDTLRQEARQALASASKDGRLANALKQAAATRSKDEEELEGLRNEARDVILSASKDGRLAAALREATFAKQRGDNNGVESLRLMARDAMLKASHDGRLAEALRAVEQARCRTREEVQKPLEEETDELQALVSDLEAAMPTASPVTSRSKRLVIGGITRSPSATELLTAAEAAPTFTASGSGAVGRVSSAVLEARAVRGKDFESYKNDFKIPAFHNNFAAAYKSLSSPGPSGSSVSAAMLDVGPLSASQKTLRPFSSAMQSSAVALSKSASAGTIPFKVTKKAPAGLRSIGASIAGLDTASKPAWGSSPLAMSGSAAWGSRMGRKSASMASLAAPVF
jgi:hypothetical protein